MELLDRNAKPIHVGDIVYTKEYGHGVIASIYAESPSLRVDFPAISPRDSFAFYDPKHVSVLFTEHDSHTQDGALVVVGMKVKTPCGAVGKVKAINHGSQTVSVDLPSENIEDTIYAPHELLSAPQSSQPETEAADDPDPGPTPFWMVWRPDTNKITRQHSSFEDAVREAQRLAAKQPGDRFVVLSAAASIENTVEMIGGAK